MGINVSDLKFQPSHQKAPEFDIVSVLLILLAIGIIVGAIYFIFYFQEGKVSELLGSGETLSMIVVENNGDRSTAYFLSFYNPKTRKQALIVIPDKTRLKVEYEDAPDYDTIDRIYQRGGMDVVRQTVERLTGTTFPFYLVYDVKAAETLADLLMGLEVIVPQKLSRLDAKEGVFIQIPRGRDLLDGAKIREMLLYHDEEMKTYIENHRTVYASLLDRSLDVEELFGNMRASKIILGNIITNMTRKDVMALVGEMKGMNSSNILFYKMYGKDVTIKDEQYITPVENGKWLRERIATVKNFIGDEGPAPIGDEIRIEVLNGSDNPGQAQSLRNYFVEYGFDVVHFGNALRSDYEKTVVIDRIGRPSLAKRIADIINCREISTSIDTGLLVDVTIIIGNDFEGKYVR